MLKWAAGCLLLLGCGQVEHGEPGDAPPANLIVIVVDTLRFDAVGPEATPAIWALGQVGVRFEAAYTTAPMTLPALTSLFTSQAPSSTGVLVNGVDVPKKLVLLPEWLGEHGYRTVGVASMATLWRRTPDRGLDQGFDDFRFVNRDYTDGLDTLALFKKELDELQVEGRHGSAPWFLFVHLADPHEPYRSFLAPEPSLAVRVDGQEIATTDPRRAPHVRRRFALEAGSHRLELEGQTEFVLRSLYLSELESGKPVPFELTQGERLAAGRKVTAEWTSEGPMTIALETWLTDKPSQREARRRYTSEVSRADQAVSGVLAELERRDLFDSSLIVFVADHGEAFGEHGHNGHSENLYDELLHVPLVIKLPTGRARSSLAEKADALVSHVDLAPTILEALGLPALPGSVGRSLMGPSEGRAVIRAETHRPEASQALACLRDRSLKLIYQPASQTFRMFDLVRDPREQTDVFGLRGAERADWQEQLRELTGDWVQAEPGGDDLEALGY